MFFFDMHALICFSFEAKAIFFHSHSFIYVLNCLNGRIAAWLYGHVSKYDVI